MNITLDHTTVKVTGDITIRIENQDHVDEFNENARILLDEFSHDNNMTTPTGAFRTLVPVIAAEEGGKYGFHTHTGEENSVRGLSFPFLIKVASDDYSVIGADQL